MEDMLQVEGTGSVWISLSVSFLLGNFHVSRFRRASLGQCPCSFAVFNL